MYNGKQQTPSRVDNNDASQHHVKIILDPHYKAPVTPLPAEQYTLPTAPKNSPPAIPNSATTPSIPKGAPATLQYVKIPPLVPTTSTLAKPVENAEPVDLEKTIYEDIGDIAARAAALLSNPSLNSLTISNEQKRNGDKTILQPVSSEKDEIYQDFAKVTEQNPPTRSDELALPEDANRGDTTFDISQLEGFNRPSVLMPKPSLLSQPKDPGDDYITESALGRVFDRANQESQRLKAVAEERAQKELQARRLQIHRVEKFATDRTNTKALAKAQKDGKIGGEISTLFRTIQSPGTVQNKIQAIAELKAKLPLTENAKKIKEFTDNFTKTVDKEITIDKSERFSDVNKLILTTIYHDDKPYINIAATEKSQNALDKLVEFLRNKDIPFERNTSGASINILPSEGPKAVGNKKYGAYYVKNKTTGQFTELAIAVPPATGKNIDKKSKTSESGNSEALIKMLSLGGHTNRFSGKPAVYFLEFGHQNFSSKTIDCYYKNEQEKEAKAPEAILKAVPERSSSGRFSRRKEVAPEPTAPGRRFIERVKSGRLSLAGRGRGGDTDDKK